MKAIKPYSKEMEEKIARYYNTLSEKERRRYAAIEADKLVQMGNYTEKEKRETRSP